MESTIDSASQIRNIGLYLQHGLALGAILFAGSIVFILFVGTSYTAYILLGPSIIGAIFYTFIFGLAGGVNQILAERLWNIQCQQNIGTGMRDGFILFVLFNIAFLPLSIIFNSIALSRWYSPTPIQIILILSIAIPIYVLMLGIIGKQVAVLLHVDKEPEIPSDFVECSHKCPHCGAVYYYATARGQNDIITCQNCAKQFSS